MYSQLNFSLTEFKKYAYSPSNTSNARGGMNEKHQSGDSGLNQLKLKYLIFTHFTTCMTLRHIAKSPHKALEGDCANERVSA